MIYRLRTALSTSARIAALITCFAAPSTSPAHAAPPYLVKDLDARGGARLETVLVASEELVFFMQRGRLYRTDGTFDGTYALAEFPGTLSQRDAVVVNGKLVLCTFNSLLFSDGTLAGTRRMEGTPCEAGFATFHGEAYFTSWALGFPARLWKTNGTPEGTAIAATFPDQYGISSYAALPEALVLRMGDDLFASDGTAAGTTKISSLPGGVDLVVAGGRVFYLVPGQNQLWTTDGTAAGTKAVKLLPNGPYDSLSMTSLGDRVVFRWVSGSSYVPWVSDGTSEGTFPLASSPVFAAPSFDIRPFTVKGSTAYYRSEGKLWKTDGTVAGTSPLHEELALSDYAVSSAHVVLRESSGKLFASDETSSGLVLLGQYPGFVTLHQSGAVALGGRTFFACVGPEEGGAELWATDGTAAGTAVVRVLNTSTLSSGLDSLVAGPSRVLLSTASKGSFATDGTRAGTQPLTHDGVPIGTAKSLLWMGETGYICGDRLWRTTGAGNATVALTPSTESCRWAAAAGSTLYFTLWNSTTSTMSLWTSDGTPQGNVHVRDLGSWTESKGGTPLGNRMLFTLAGGSYRFDPWVSDGTAAGTYRLKDLDGIAQSLEELPVVVGSWGYFRTGPYELWRTDGSVGGTSRVLPDMNVYLLGGAFEGRLLVAAWKTDSSAMGVWATDGTPAGTVLVKDLTGDPSSSVRSIVVSGGRVYIATRQGFNAPANLWVTDGTPVGTTRLSTAVFAENLTAVPGGIVFAGTPTTTTWEGPVFGDPFFAKSEPWFSDGTPEGTNFLGEINLGPFGSMPGSFASLGSMILFAAEEFVHGRELWRFDPAATSGALYTLEPCRLADTRLPGQQPPLHVLFERDFQVTGRCGVPSDARAVALNVTVTGSTGPAYVELGPRGRGPNGTRSTSVATGQTRASSMTLGLDPVSDGWITMRLFGSETADVILDVSGYFK